MTGSSDGQAAPDSGGFPGPVTVRVAGRLRGELDLPADKSVAHRALLFNAMGEGEAQISLSRPGADVRSTAGALARLGAVVEEAATEATAAAAEAGGLVAAAGSVALGAAGVRYRVRGGGRRGRARLPGGGDERLDCGNSGTSMRLMAGAVAGRPGSVELDGDDSLRRRPMERVAAPLRAMGASVDTVEGHAPLTITGRERLEAQRHLLPVASAQVLGAISLAALAADGRTVVDVPGPTRDHTERMLGWLGAPIGRDGLRTTIEGPAGFRARSMRVPADLSSAAFWLAAATLHPDAELRLVGVGLNPSRLAIVDVLRRMGADITIVPRGQSDRGGQSDARGPRRQGGADGQGGPEPEGDLVVRGGRPLRAISLSGALVAELIDELPLLAVVMAAAEGTSELRDAAELRVKESDRVALVVQGLRAIGAEAEELPDGWRVRRGRPRSATIETAGDHRIAMAFAVAALAGVADGAVIDDPACADVSYPGFWDDLVAVAGSKALEVGPSPADPPEAIAAPYPAVARP